jgi:hypothetical protein
MVDVGLFELMSRSSTARRMVSTPTESDFKVISMCFHRTTRQKICNNLVIFATFSRRIRFSAGKKKILLEKTWLWSFFFGFFVSGCCNRF